MSEKKKYKEREKKGEEINYLEIMRAQEYYNEVRLPGYNHLLGSLEGKTLVAKVAGMLNFSIGNL